jgi:hypothetical protein
MIVLGEEVVLPDPKDDQAVFDYVVKFLRKQGCKSMGECNCRYRDNMGHACAVGCLIPDDEYDVRMEGRTVEHIPLFFDEYNMSLLKDLQWHVHDSVGELEEYNYKYVAENHGLEVPK